jgi:hypothetical protein
MPFINPENRAKQSFDTAINDKLYTFELIALYDEKGVVMNVYEGNTAIVLGLRLFANRNLTPNKNIDIVCLTGANIEDITHNTLENIDIYVA